MFKLSSDTSAAPTGTATTEKARISDRITANTFLDIGTPPYIIYILIIYLFL
jgi:hypothetical protein